MKENVWKTYTDEQEKELEALSGRYKAFLNAGKTERECAAEAIRLARAAGYQSLEEVQQTGKKLEAGDKVYACGMKKMLVLFQIGRKPLEDGMRILGAHIDSPRLDLKQNPLYEDTEMAYLDTHYYGGVKNYQWVTIPLAIHGVVAKKDGSVVEICIGEKEDDPVVFISDLLIHLAAQQMDKKAKVVIEGENLDILIGSRPLAKTEGEEPIAEMVNSLSLLLREAISAGELVIELDKELDIVCHYITIQKLRYGDRLDVAFDVSEECSDLAIPKFTLQPLLENAIVYGVECMLEPCAVTVRIFTEGEVCVCQVKNSGPAPEADLMEKLRSGQIVPRGNGVGLLNIDRRIKAVFGDEYGIRVYRKEDEQITVAEARFQIRSAESCKGLFAAAEGAARETKSQKCGEGGKADETEIQSYGCR